MHRISNHLLSLLYFLIFSITTQQWHYSLAEEYNAVLITANGNELSDDTNNDILESTFAEQQGEGAYSHGRKLHYAQIITRMEWKRIMRMRDRSDDSSSGGSYDNIFYYAVSKGKHKGMIYFGSGSRKGKKKKGKKNKWKKKKEDIFFPFPDGGGNIMMRRMRRRMMMGFEAFRSSRARNPRRGGFGRRRRMMRNRRRPNIPMTAGPTISVQPSITPSTPAGPSTSPPTPAGPSPTTGPLSGPSTPGPTLAVGDAIDLQLQIDYTWFPDSGVAPTQAEIDEMVAATNPFFLSQIQTALSSTTSFDGTITSSSYDAATEFFTSTWDTVTTGSGTSRENLGSVVLSINAISYITDALVPLTGNTFENIQAVAIEVL